jgi:5-amino-6-(5-phosphoribosylamino)uracil reductase
LSTVDNQRSVLSRVVAVDWEDGAVMPYVVVSCAVSVDGFIDDAEPARLLLSDAADFDRVDGVRASCDAILVGATTLRRDDPRLRVRSPERQQERVARGLSPQPLKVTISGSGDLSPGLRFFSGGGAVVYTTSLGAGRLGDRDGVVDLGASVALPAVLADLAGRGVRRLMVEGGQSVLTRFLTEGLVDEIQLAVAPVLVGAVDAPRFVGPGRFPGGRMRVAEVRPVGDLVLIRYLLAPAAPSG